MTLYLYLSKKRSAWYQSSSTMFGPIWTAWLWVWLAAGCLSVQILSETGHIYHLPLHYGGQGCVSDFMIRSRHSRTISDMEHQSQGGKCQRMQSNWCDVKCCAITVSQLYPLGIKYLIKSGNCISTECIGHSLVTYCTNHCRIKSVIALFDKELTLS